MRVVLLKDAGLEEALLGLSLSYNCQTGHDMLRVANRLADKDGGHNKFLESVAVWLDITAPRDWWAQFDTYRIGVSKQSESTMHTLTKRPLSMEDFSEGTDPRAVALVNEYIAAKDWKRAKKNLPEGFLQRRVVCLNYKVLRHIIKQRAEHRLPEWSLFCESVIRQARFPSWVR